jgi:hypothetical protein
MVGYGVRLPTWISSTAFPKLPWRAPTWRKYSLRVACNAKGPGLIECNPVLHSISELLEADFSVILVVISACNSDNMIKYRSLFVTFYKIIQRQCANCSIGDGLFVADRAGRPVLWSQCLGYIQ